ncbi:hypothetical protein SLEP1_g3393 [Rubroshorea leprosula]|uniref:Uncharacterized protein n=1 Tax=Rubroshorea leprosula TaxID=152421 RepID=A0AAV5HK84_9ROSI|nr:hypothetical protein SLEP1_g3393 [Rubroshorea leprosula]
MKTWVGLGLSGLRTQEMVEVGGSGGGGGYGVNVLGNGIKGGERLKGDVYRRTLMENEGNRLSMNLASSMMEIRRPIPAEGYRTMVSSIILPAKDDHTVEDWP